MSHGSQETLHTLHCARVVGPPKARDNCPSERPFGDIQRRANSLIGPQELNLNPRFSGYLLAIGVLSVNGGTGRLINNEVRSQNWRNIVRTNNNSLTKEVLKWEN